MAMSDDVVEKINRMTEKDIIVGITDKVDLYDFLGVDWKASDAELKAAIRKFVLQYHPDRNPGDESCEKKLQALNKVKNIILDSDKRAKYNALYCNFINVSAGFENLNNNYTASSPDPQEPDPQQPDPQQPDPQQPDPQQPDPQQPDPQQPDPQQPDPQQLGLQQTNPPQQPTIDEPDAYDGLKDKRLHKDDKKNVIPGNGLKAKPVDFKHTEKLELKGDDIMEDLWRFWMYLWKWSIGKTVDISLDVLNFGLYAPFEERKLMNQTKELQKKTALHYGDELYEQNRKKAEENANLFQKSFDEILTNIDNRKTGVPETWETWRNEPVFFNRLVQIEAQAAANPNSPEAKFWEKFKSFPEIAKNLYEKEKHLRYLAVHIATLDEAVNNPQEYKLPTNVSNKIKDMEKLLMKEKNPAQLKAKMKAEMDTLRAGITGTDYVSQKIIENLDKMERVATGAETDVQAIKNSFRKSMENIKEINPVSDRIETASKAIYDKLMVNVEKIVLLYADNPQAMSANIRNYMNHMDKALVGAENSSLDFLDNKNNIKDMIKAKSGRGVTREAKAKSSITDALNSINDFVVDGRPIGSREVPNFVRDNPMSGGRTEIFESIKNFAERRV